jgi:hypothetical protein
MLNVSTHLWTKCLLMSLSYSTQCVNVFVVWTFWATPPTHSYIMTGADRHNR